MGLHALQKGTERRGERERVRGGGQYNHMMNNFRKNWKIWRRRKQSRKQRAVAFCFGIPLFLLWCFVHGRFQS